MLGSLGSCLDPACLGALWEQIQVQMEGQLSTSAPLGLGQRERAGRGPGSEDRKKGLRWGPFPWSWRGLFTWLESHLPPENLPRGERELSRKITDPALFLPLG